MALMSRSTHDPKLTRWWWRALREWVYELVDPLWAAFRGENSDEIALANVTGINDVSASELAILDGLTATNTELNKLSGLTAEASELNKADRTQADGLAEASKNVVLDANKDILGKRYDISRSLLEAIAGKPYLRLDGVDDYVDMGNNIIGGFKGLTLEVFIQINSSAGALQDIMGAVKDDASVNRSAYIRIANGVLQVTIKTDVGVATVTSSEDIRDGRWHHIIATYDGSILILYLDGVSLGSASHSGKLYSHGYSFRLGAFHNAINYLDGEIASARILNRSLSADEIKALCSGAPLDYADVGASQADLVTNGEDWTGATGSTPPNSWSDSGPGTATYIIRDNTPVANFGDDKALELTASGGSKTLYQGVAQAGKRCRVSFVYRNLDGSSSSYVVLGSDGNKVTLQNTGISGDGILFVHEFMADGTDLKFFVDTNGTLQIDHVQVVQVGCVAAYLPDGITHAQWQDASGNELHGSVNGAIPLNLPSGHVARYIKQGITGDTTLSAAVPAGYRIKSMVAEVSGASAGMRLNIGTSAGGTDVVNNQDISSNGLFDLTVAKNIFSFSTAQSLYVNDDGGTAWSGVSVDLYIDLERVK